MKRFIQLGDLRSMRNNNNAWSMIILAMAAIAAWAGVLLEPAKPAKAVDNTQSSAVYTITTPSSQRNVVKIKMQGDNPSSEIETCGARKSITWEQPVGGIRTSAPITLDVTCDSATAVHMGDKTLKSESSYWIVQDGWWRCSLSRRGR